MPVDDPHAAEAAQRWPEQHTESQQRLSALSEAERAALMERGAAVERQLGELCSAGASPADPAVQVLVAEHYRWVSAFWTPDRDAYIGLARMYVEDPRFAAHYDAVAPGLAVILRDAIEVWAPVHL